MVKNRNELLQVAAQNANQLKTHLRHSISSFMETQQVSVEELAFVLGITEDELMQIIEGDGNVTVDVLSKLLVATDNVVEVKPIGASPMRSYGPGMPPSGGFPNPFPPVDRFGRPVPPPPHMMGGNPFTPPVGGRRTEQQPQAQTKQGRDSRGRFTSKVAPAAQPRQPRQSATHRPMQQRQQPAGQEVNPYATLSRDALVNIISQNLWDGEIDVQNATQGELIEFVYGKEQLLRQRTEQRQEVTQEQVQQSTETTNGGNAIDKFLGMLQNMAEEARNNPQLAETLARFMPK